MTLLARRREVAAADLRWRLERARWSLAAAPLRARVARHRTMLAVACGFFGGIGVGLVRWRPVLRTLGLLGNVAALALRTPLGAQLVASALRGRDALRTRGAGATTPN